jgi:acetyl esterase/lipase
MPSLVCAALVLTASPAFAQRALLARTDIAYSAGADSSQSLDLYLPERRPSTPFPTVIFIHGGSLQSGDRRDLPYATICHNFVVAGIACASMNYRLVRTAKWPAQPRDVAAAVSWVYSNITARGGDSRRIFLLGHSSGCHLAALITSDTTYLTAERLSSRDVAGVVAMGCLLRQIPPAIEDSAKLRAFFTSGRWIYPSLELFRDADPTVHAGRHVPPTLVLIAESEQQQPPILESAETFAARVRATGGNVEIKVLPQRTHESALTMMADPLDPTFIGIVGFITRVGR